MLALLSRLLAWLYRRIVGRQPNADRYQSHRQAAIGKECN